MLIRVNFVEIGNFPQLDIEHWYERGRWLPLLI